MQTVNQTFTLMCGIELVAQYTNTKPGYTPEQWVTDMHAQIGCQVTWAEMADAGYTLQVS